jgi:FtsZ-interacting cell division protein ZipA
MSNRLRLSTGLPDLITFLPDKPYSLICGWRDDGVEVFMDIDKKQHSDLGNDKDLKNAEGNNVTGVKTSDLRRYDDKPAKPANQDPRAKDPRNQDPRSQDPRTQSLTQHPANEDPTKHDPVHDSTTSDSREHDKSKTATGGSN